MPVLSFEEMQVVRRYVENEVRRDVVIRFFTSSSGGIIVPGRECAACRPVQDLLEEVAGLSGKVTIETIDYYANPIAAQRQGVTRVPCFTISRDGSSRARFYGLPAGRLLPTLLSTLLGASARGSPFQLETRRRLRRLSEDVHIQVFVSANSPYCDETASAAAAMARESERVSADVIEVGSFPDMVDLQKIRGVPKTVINGRVQFTGLLNEAALLRQTLRAIGEVQSGSEQIVDYSDQMTQLNL